MDTRNGQLVGLSPLELAAGWPLGRCDSGITARRGGGAEDAVRTLEEIVLEVSAGQTCYVAFSGGKDSSAVLAVATRARRRHGLEDPVPVTDVYPGVAGADEDEWQQLVVRHLGLRDWIRADRNAQCDLIGPAAQSILGRYGVTWPPTIASNLPLWQEASGHVMLTGEGGDGVFGSHRITEALSWLRRPTASPSAILRSLRAVAPRELRRRAISGQMGFPWLTPAAREAVFAVLGPSVLDEPLHAHRAMVDEVCAKAITVGLHNMSVVAHDHGTSLFHPLADPRFLSALAPVIGRFGFPDASGLIAALFCDLLPRATIERRTKATFNHAYFGPRSRNFAEEWDGGGVDEELVDGRALRAHWRGDQPVLMSYMLLQSAWSAQRRSEQSPDHPSEEASGASTPR